MATAKFTSPISTATTTQAVTHDGAIVAAPAWVPGRLALYYTSYKLGNPDIFYHDLTTGQRRAIARYSGLNTAAAVSPDGTKVAMILSKGGSPNVYVCNADGTDLKKLTTTSEDSSPCWSPDGQWICFATKIKCAAVAGQGAGRRRAKFSESSEPSACRIRPNRTGRRTANGSHSRRKVASLTFAWCRPAGARSPSWCPARTRPGRRTPGR